MDDQEGRWDEFYRSNSRPWRGVTDAQYPFPHGGKVLDIGCGTGKTVASLIEEGYDVTGADFSKVAADRCAELYGDRVRAVKCDACDLPFDDAEFDGVVMFHVIEHLDDYEVMRAVSEAVRVLKQGHFLMIRAFSVDDMRSDKGERIDENTVVRGNGIRYRYYTEHDIRRLFWTGEFGMLRTVKDTTRFGEERARIEAAFRKA